MLTLTRGVGWEMCGLPVHNLKGKYSSRTVCMLATSDSSVGDP